MSMSRMWRVSFQACLIVAAGGATMAIAQSHGQPVEYRILRQPDSKHSGETMPGSPKPSIFAKPVQPYAYGWFGAKTSPHWSRQFGNRRAHTQWTLK